jgi:hypothetical protein
MIIRRNVELEARLIADILDLSAIRKGKIGLHLKQSTLTCAARGTERFPAGHRSKRVWGSIRAGRKRALRARRSVAFDPGSRRSRTSSLGRHARDRALRRRAS